MHVVATRGSVQQAVLKHDTSHTLPLTMLFCTMLQLPLLKRFMPL
jgi:hypothetical protein